MSAPPGFRPSHLLCHRPRTVLQGLVRFYRYFIRPSLGNRCRYDPTCSAFALEALQRHGAAAGTVLAMGRVLRCHPWCDGGHDPVPAAGSPLFTRLFRPAWQRSAGEAGATPDSVPEIAAVNASPPVTAASTSTLP